MNKKPKQRRNVINHFSSNVSKTRPKISKLEAYFELQRQEHEAARHIQRAWRRTRILLPWRKAVKAMMAVVSIQRIARGMVTRRIVARWYLMRKAFAIQIQARSRRYLSNLKMRPILQQECQMVIRIQRVARGMIGRRRALLTLYNIAAIRIQALWRGCVDRSRSDHQWLHRLIIPIQNLVRRKLALNKFDAERKRLTTAALIIQRKYRSYRAGMIIGEKLHVREMKYREQTIKCLVAEEEYCNTEINRIMNRVVKNQLKEKAMLAEKLLQKQEEVIYRYENDWIELDHQLDTLSPRAFEQGYHVELRQNLEQYRELITDAKKLYLFKYQKEVKQYDEALEQQINELEDYALLHQRARKWCSQEYEDRRHATYQRDIIQRRRTKRLAVAEERRKWQVFYYTKDGKPDKKRKPGRPWDPTAFAGPEKETYSGGANVDLLAFIRNNQAQKEVLVKKKLQQQLQQQQDIKLDVTESVSQTMNQLSLSTYLEEIRVYEQMVQPLFQVMQKNMNLVQKMTAEEVSNDVISRKTETSHGDKPILVSPSSQNMSEQLPFNSFSGANNIPNSPYRSNSQRDPPVTAATEVFDGTIESLFSLHTSIPKKNKLSLNRQQNRTNNSYHSSRLSSPLVQLSQQQQLDSQIQTRQSTFPSSSTSSNAPREHHQRKGVRSHVANILTIIHSDNDHYSDQQGDLFNKREKLPNIPSSTFNHENDFDDDDNEISVIDLLESTFQAKKPKYQYRISNSSRSTQLIENHGRLWKRSKKQYLPTEESFQEYFAALSRSVTVNNEKQKKTGTVGEGKGVNEVEDESCSVASTGSFHKNNLPQELRMNASNSTMSSSISASSFLLKDLKLEDGATLSTVSRDTANPNTNSHEASKMDLFRQEQQAISADLHERLRKRKQEKRRLGSIPWDLLDQVNAARYRFENERAYTEFHKKI
jgi:hypothetical protein